MKRLKLPFSIPPVVRNRISFWCQLFLFFVSAITIGAIVVDYGFELSEREMVVIHQIYDSSWWIYLITFSLRLLFQWSDITRKTIFMTALLGLSLYLSLLPKCFTLSESAQWLSGVWNLLGNKFYLIATIGLFALLEVSKGIVGFINKKTNPALLMGACFAVIILLGTLLLLLPRSTHEHIQLSVTDAFFVSTSAVCVTGLSPVDIAQTFSVEGQIIIALLIQTGGLGVMTITSFFAMFFMGGTGLYNQLALRDIVGSSDTFSSLISTLLYILGFTFIIEACGACCIWLSIHSTLGMNLHEEIFFSLFHAVSAFCNAGFSTLTGNLGNPSIQTGHNAFFICISLLVILGGIGFPILVNFKTILSYHLRGLAYRLFHKESRRVRYRHLTNINTKIVLGITTVLLVTGTVTIALLEWNEAFAGMSVIDKLTQSLFNAASPRTAGFNSIDLTRFSLLAIAAYTILMWIGGASQSTAGGIKVNTLAVALANFISVIRGRNSVVMFHREISSDSVRRASATIFGSIFTILAFFTLLVLLEPELSPKGLFFETVSAFCTVGASLNITPALGNAGKIVVAVLMFIGRVGLITVLMSVTRQTGTPRHRFPKDNVIIN